MKRSGENIKITIINNNTTLVVIDIKILKKNYK